ncbi:MAG: GNAT family N-acetyltransferase [Solibacillus sp.]|uniref:GNAT family N-acetyltransferase n=1 Tax=unclassified Solibacillus TaxID=2637870 RepID=UPI0030F6A712
MQIISYNSNYAEQIATLLNNYLPFEPESAQTVDQADGVRFICVTNTNEVIGYIAGYLIQNFDADFPYYKEELSNLAEYVSEHLCMYSSHFVVHPNYRNKGIGSKLVTAYVEAAQQIAQSIIVVGWVQSDINKWAAKAQFLKHGFTSFKYMPRYFEPYEVHCPSCGGLCYCDAEIFVK